MIARDRHPLVCDVTAWRGLIFFFVLFVEVDQQRFGELPPPAG